MKLSLRSFLCALLAIVVGFQIAQLQAHAQASDLAEVESTEESASNSPIQQCENPDTPYKPVKCCCCENPETDSSASPTGGPVEEATHEVRDAVANPDESITDTFTLTHHQVAFDYRVGRGSASCKQCGGRIGSGAELFNLDLQRRHRYRDMTVYSSFGPGVYNTYDTKLSIYEYDGGIMADLFEPQDLAPRRFVDGLEGDTRDGVLMNVANKGYKDLRLYDGADQAVTQLASAEKAVLTSHNGMTHTFELVQMESFTGIIGGQANTPLIDPDNLPGADLISHWEFNEGTGSTAGDSAGSNDGTITGAAWVTSGAPSGGDALSFDGNGDEVNAGNVPIGSAGGTNGGFTAAFWANPDSTQLRNNPVFISKYKGVSGERSFMVDGYKNGGKLRFQLYNLNGTSGATLITPQEVIVRDTWQHVAVTYDGHFQRIFVNGIQVAQSADLDTDFSTARSADLIIGSRGGAAYQANQLVGEMDDVRLYDRPLTGPELEAVMERELLANYDFEENTGTTTADGSGNGNTGTLFGGASWTTGGFAGNAIDFDGVDDGVNLGNDAAILSPHWITVAAWVKPDTLANASGGNGARNIVSKGDGVFLRINDGEYQVGTGNNVRATFDAPSGDVGEWVHLAGTFDGERWRLYRNGVVVGVDTNSTGASSGDEEWVVGNQADGTRPFDGVIDDVYIYNYPLSADEIASLSELPLKGGRLVEIADRNGFSKTITYRDSDFTAQELIDAPDRRWQINSVTDAYGREATFHYKATQESGRWVVERIDLPNTEDIDYVYDNSGRLAEVNHADGSQSNIDYGVNSNSQTTTVTYQDASALGTHRNKTVYLTNVTVTAGLEGAELYSQSSLMVRIVVNGSDEVSFYAEGGATKLVYTGQGKLAQHKLVTEVRYYEDGWSFNTPGDPSSGVNGTLESTFASSHNAFTPQTFENMKTATYPTIKDSAGRSYGFQYDDDTFQTRKTYPDGSIERWAYNQFKQVTRHEDRLGRVTKLGYDSDGNRTSIETGIVNTAVFDVQFPNRSDAAINDVQVTTGNGFARDEYASMTCTYYNGTEGPAVSGITGAAATPSKGLKKSETDARGNTTHYVYDANNFQIAMIEPADNPGDDRAITLYSYDSAGRMQTTTDPLERVTTFAYDERDRQKTTTYEDGSTEEYFYANELSGGAGNLANLLVAFKDRNDNYTQFRYDGHGRMVMSIGGITTETDALNQSFTEDPAYHNVRLCSYLAGTSLKTVCITNGERVEMAYDYRHRPLATTIHTREPGTFPNAVDLVDVDGDGSTTDDDGQLTSRMVYQDNLPFAAVDSYGRATYFVYRTSDNALIRIVKEAARGGTGLNPDTATFANVTALTRDLTYEDASALAVNDIGGAPYIIVDYILDNAGQVTSIVDPRNVQHDVVYDSRGRVTLQTQAVGMAIAAKTELFYDAQSNVTEMRGARYFDASDTEGFEKSFITMAYNGRNLLKSRTVGAGDSTYDAFVTSGGSTGRGAKATETFSYYLDRRMAKRIDFNGNDPQYTASEHEWLTIWRACCERLRAQIDPVGNGRAIGTDFAGNTTHRAAIEDLISEVQTLPDGRKFIQNSDNGGPGIWDVPDAKTLAESTTRFDSKHRPVATTVWLEPLGEVDPNDAPILYGGTIRGGTNAQSAGTGLGDGDGLTTLFYYTEDLHEVMVVSAGVEGPPNRGSNPTHVLVHQFSGAPTINLQPLLDELSNDGIEILDLDNTNASAVASINPEGEIRAAIMDGAGRIVASAWLDPTNNTPITWSTTNHDRVVSVNGFGDVVEAITISGLNNVKHGRVDGLGRLIQTIDAEDNATFAVYDNGGNSIRTRDANDVGSDCDYDARSRRISCTDTQGDSRSWTFNLASQLLTSTDGKSVSSAAPSVYDARGRLLETTTRLAALDKNSRAYDPNSNLISVTDAESGTTNYEYDPRNLRIATKFPGHNPTSVVGDSDYDKYEYLHDGLRRLLVKTDPQGDTATYLYDLASRTEQRDYRTESNSTDSNSDGVPDGTISDSDVMTYDDASRLLTAVSGRYSNTVTKAYDTIGRLSSEALNIGGQTYTVGYDAFDDDSRLTTLTYPDGSQVKRTYTDRNQREETRYDADGTGGGVSVLIADCGYDAGMRETSRALGNGLDTAFAYRDDNLLESITVETAPGNDDRPGLSMAYAYDANKNLTAEDFDDSGVMDRYGVDLNQDAKDRLTSWTRDLTTTSIDSQTWTLSFEHDWEDTTVTDASTSVTESRTFNAVHEILTIDPDDDPMTANELTQTHDAKGNLSNDGQGRVFVHDFDNQLSQVTVSPGSSHGTVGTHSYAYDALGRRVSKTTSSVTTVYIQSGAQVLAEYTSGTAASSPERKYIYGVYIDEPIAMIDATGSGEDTYYYHRNRQYSVIGLSDDTGAVVERYAYTAYGKPTILAPDGVTVRTVSSFGNAYMHTGRRFDHESGLYYYRARYYGPVLGRFLERDPLGYPDGLNGYAAYHILKFGLDPMGLKRLIEALEDGKLTPGEIGDLNLTQDEQKIIIESVEGWFFKTEDNLNDSQKRRADAKWDCPDRYQHMADYLNRKNAKLLLLHRNKVFQKYVDEMYSTLKEANPVHFAFENGYIIGSGEDLLGREQSRGWAAAETVLYIATLKGGNWLSSRISRTIANRGDDVAGSLTVQPCPKGQSYSASELESAAKLFVEGHEVVLRPAAKGAARGSGTSDLLVNGKPADVYTPTTSNYDNVWGKIADKGDQADVIVVDLSETSITPDAFDNIMNDFAESGIDSIEEVIILPKGDGPSVSHTR